MPIRLRQAPGDSVALCVLILFATRPVFTDAADVELVPAERWSSAFADEEIPIVMTVRGENAASGTIRWSHSINNRTLDSGSVAVVEEDVDRGKAALSLSPQPLRDGVVLKTTLSASFISPDAAEAAASYDQTIWLFPRAPLAGRHEWAAGLDIRLLDPDGNTAAAFDEIELPYKRIQNLNGLNDPDWHGILIIGEGLPLLKQPMTWQTALEAAASGRRVILLTPIDGSLVLPGLDLSQQQAGIPVPTELRLARHHIIAEFDKRLDHLAWPGGDNTVPARGLSVESRRGRLLADVSENPRALPWMELKYADHDGTLVMCGFEIIAHWDNGPTPRYLLVRLLEAVSRSDSDPEDFLRRQGLSQTDNPTRPSRE